MWAAAFSAHALLARAGSPILAMLPPVALVGFADTVLDDGGRPFFAVLFLLGVLAIILADGVRRMRLWGPIWPWQGRSGRRHSIPLRGATRVAVIAGTIEKRKGQSVPEWLQIDNQARSGRVLQAPAREAIPIPVTEQLIVELYSK